MTNCMDTLGTEPLPSWRGLSHMTHSLIHCYGLTRLFTFCAHRCKIKNTNIMKKMYSEQGLGQSSTSPACAVCVLQNLGEKHKVQLHDKQFLLRDCTPKMDLLSNSFLICLTVVTRLMSGTSCENPTSTGRFEENGKGYSLETFHIYQFNGNQQQNH